LDRRPNGPGKDCSKGWNMREMSGSKIIVAVAFVAWCTAMVGCLSRSEPPMGMANGYPSTQRTTVYPNPTPGAGSPQMVRGPDGMIRQASFGQPGGPEDVHADGKLGMPRVMPDGSIVQNPGMMPGPMMVASPPLPTELNRYPGPPHRVAPPDILLIEA